MEKATRSNKNLRLKKPINQNLRWKKRQETIKILIKKGDMNKSILVKRNRY